MPVSYTAPEDPQAPSQTASPDLPAEAVGDVPATLDFVPPATIPMLLDIQDRLSILHRYPNFFVLATSSPDHQATPPCASDAASREEEQNGNGEVKAEMQTLAGVPNVPARAKTLFGTLLGRLRYDQLERPGKVGEMPLVAIYIPAWLETIIVTIVVMASFAAHAINMFYYPRYEQDEGTYMMSAWAITRGLIQAYPYDYAHPPLAWMQIAAWVQLTGGFFTFGNAINSGRVLILLYAIASTLLVYLIARCLGAHLSVCLLATAIFSFSPLSIVLQREVLLDNIAIFWVLLSLYLLLISKGRLLYTISAGIFFGVALLSKEVVLVLLPTMIYILWLYSARFQRTFTFVTFTYIVIACGSTFVLMATLKGELFPNSWHLPWDHSLHLSIIATYAAQLKRGQGEGSILTSWIFWTQYDPLLPVIGIATPIFNLIVGWWDRKLLFLSLLALSFWALLLRGGVIFPFYIIPLIPLIALNTAFTLNTLAQWIGRLMRFKLVQVWLIFAVLVAVIPHDVQYSLNPINLFTSRTALVHTDALMWIREHVPRTAVIIVDPTLYVDLHEQDGDGVGDGTTYPYAHVYLNAALDPDLHNTLLQGNWDRIDYIVVNTKMLNDIETIGRGMNMIKTALEHSILRADFRRDTYDLMQIYQVIHTTAPPVV
jgi:4-amino-4-deoxy-L-arabinose transferase-like glycosyltransferase